MFRKLKPRFFSVFPFLLCIAVQPAHGSEIAEVFGVKASDGLIKLERTAYNAYYDNKLRIPTLVTYFINAEFGKTPPPRGRFKIFNKDPDARITRPVSNKEYIGSRFHRARLAPYYIAGGDRDHDGKYADLDENISDKDDERTIHEINYLSNVTPQHLTCFNRGNGVWYALNSFIRNKIVHNYVNPSVWVYAGAIIDDLNDDNSWTGKGGDIAVPDRFFKIVMEYQSDGQLTAMAFLFPHYMKENGRCNDGGRPFSHPDHLTTVKAIEDLTGHRFFTGFSPDDRLQLINRPGVEIWNTYYSGL